MRPSLAVVDLATGEAQDVVELGSALQGLSIRHLAVADDGEAVFACQWEGDPMDGPPLVGLLSKDGSARLLDMPDDDLASLDNYVGSIALCAAGRVIAATSPRGGTAAFWERASGRYLGRKRLPDVCGVAPMPADDRESLFVLTSGHAGAHLAQATSSDLKRFGGSDLAALAFDNHILAL